MSYTAAGSCPMVQAYSIIFSTAVLGEPFTPDCDDVDGNLGNIQTAMTDLTASYVDFSECFTSINVIICIIYFSILYCNKEKNGFSDKICEQINKSLADLAANGFLPQ